MIESVYQAYLQYGRQAENRLDCPRSRQNVQVKITEGARRHAQDELSGHIRVALTFHPSSSLRQRVSRESTKICRQFTQIGPTALVDDFGRKWRLEMGGW